MKTFRIGLFVALCAVFGMPLVAHADALGQTIGFQTDKTYDIAGVASVSATLRAVGIHNYVYVENRAWSMLTPDQQVQLQSQVSAFSSIFDTVIWPKATAFWGLPSLSINGDDHITILIEQMVAGAGGYFRDVNHYPPAQAPGSNGREMIYMSLSGLGSGNSSALAAHEFQHVISFNQKEVINHADDDVWLNEARSEYDITLTGFNSPFEGSTLSHRVETFVSAPSDSLVEWPNTVADYAIATLFTHYLTDRFSPAILQSTIHSPLAGVAAVNAYLSSAGTGEKFGDVFSEWMVAAYLNDRTGDVRYGYSTLGLQNFHVTSQSSTVISPGGTAVTALQLKEWQPSWLLFIPSAQDSVSPNLSVTVTGQTGIGWGGAYIANYGGSNRTVGQWRAPNGATTVSVPMQNNGRLQSLVFMATQGTDQVVGNRTIVSQSLSVSAALGSGSAATTTVVGPTPAPAPISYAAVHDGDLLRRSGQAEVYVVWGAYRRYLPSGVLALYGFDTRPVAAMSDDGFSHYTTSNYIRAEHDKKVYAVWPDGTKHWLNITAAQWTASGRDWGAIFTVNDREAAFYKVGPDITQ